MRMSLKLIPATLLALLLLFAVACKSGGGDNNDSSSNQPAGEAGDAGGESTSEQGGTSGESEDLVLSAIEALGRSADDFQQEVTSLEGAMAIDMTMGEMSMGLGGDFAFQSPDRMYMTMEFSGGEDTLIDLGELGTMEILLIGEDVYIKMAFLGDQWVKASLDDLGVDADQFRKLLSDQSPFDYSAIIDSLGDEVQVHDLGIEDVEGRSLQHYRVSSDFATLMEAMSGTLGNDLSGATFPTDEISGPVVMDLWLDTGTFLPYKLTAKGSFVVAQGVIEGDPGTFSFHMNIEVEEYNGQVTFPDAPADAIDMADISEDTFDFPE
jgi:hypothetical protein